MPALANLVYTEFDTTQGNLLADIQTAILSSAAWSRPNAGAKPHTYKATTTRGADMVFDLADSALTANNMIIGVWRAYDGTTFTDKVQRYLWWRNSGGVATTQPLHVVVSASKEHIYIAVEGPRASETGAENATLGSSRQSFFMCDLVPYHESDAVPVVFAGGQRNNALTSDLLVDTLGQLSRNAAANGAWDTCRVFTLAHPSVGVGAGMNAQRQTMDGNYYLSPYVCISDKDGFRGRLATFFHAGIQAPDVQHADLPGPPLGSKVTYDGQLYKLLSPTKSAPNVSNYNQFGVVVNNSGSARAHAVAVPCT